MAQSVYIDCRFVRYHAYIQIAPTARKSHKRTDGMGKAAPPRLPPRTATRWTGRAWHAEGTLRIPARRRLTHRIATTSPATPRLPDTAGGAMIAATGQSSGKKDGKRRNGERSGEQGGTARRERMRVENGRIRKRWLISKTLPRKAFRWAGRRNMHICVDIMDCSIYIYDLPTVCYSIGVERE